MSVVPASVRGVPAPLAAEDLRDNASWLRHLARSLVHRDDVAEDLVQETWMVALRSPPARDRPLRPWLAGVLRNLAYKRRRGDARRSKRELTAPVLSDGASTPEALVARAEAEHLLGQHVDALEEPYRSTVVLTYREHLTSSELGERMGVPASTVRARLRHALSELRRRLEARHGRAWCILLWPLAGREGTGPVPYVGGGRAVLRTIGALALPLVWAVGAQHGVRGAREQPAPVAAMAQRARSAEGTRAAEAPIPTWLTQAGAPSRGVAGRVLFEGAPVRGAEVRLVTEPSETGVRAEPRAVTDADGRFDLGRQPPLHGLLVATAPGRTAAMRPVELADPTLAVDAIELRVEPCTAAVHGVVHDAGGGVIPGARVRLLGEDGAPGPRATADEHGAYRICVPPGDVMIAVEAAGYGGVSVELTAYAPKRRDLALSPEAIVTGRVVRQDGAGVPNALVSLVPTAPAASTSAVVLGWTDEHGRFVLGGVAGGAHRVIARADGLGSGRPVEIAATPGERSDEVTCTLEPTRRLEGVVVEAGRPVPGARIFAQSRVELSGAMAISQRDGTFVAEGVPRGALDVSVEGRQLEQPAPADPAQGAPLRLEVAAAAQVRGRVVRSGRPVPHARIRAVAAGTSEATEADGEGRFTLRSAQGGPVTLYGEAPTRDARGRLVLSSATPDEVELSLDAEGLVAGTIVDEAGTPIAGASVRVTPDGADAPPGESTSDEAGRFVARALGAGHYVVSVEVRGAGRDHLLERPIHLDHAAAEIRGLQIALPLVRAALRGRVVSEGGLADVRVMAMPLENGRVRASAFDDLPSALTDAEGRFVLPDLPVGDYALSARAPSGAEGKLARATPGKADFEISLAPAAALAGTLTGFRDGADVWIARDDLASLGPPVRAIAARSTFHVRGLAPGTYHVSATAADGGDVGTVVLAPGRPAQIALRNRGLARLAGRVTDVGGRQIAGVRCVRGPALGAVVWQPLPETATTDTEGRFAFSAGPAGPTRVSCDGTFGRYSDARVRVELPPGGAATVALSLVRLPEGLAGTLPGALPHYGAALDPDGDGGRFRSVAEGGPAFRAGLRAGDAVIAVDRRPVQALTPSAVAALLLDHAGSEAIALEIERQGARLAVTLPASH